MTYSIILLQCANRGGHFGQGSFTNALMPHFQDNPKFELTVVLTDTAGLDKAKKSVINEITTFSIPSLLGQKRLSSEPVPEQKFYALKLAGIIYEHIYQKPNPVIWVNTIDYLNVCSELRKLLPIMKLFYVHHSFSWKYLLNISDSHFKTLWTENKASLSSKPFEMTEYQRRMVLLADQAVAVTHHARNFFIDVLEIPEKKIRTIYNGSNESNFSYDKKRSLRQAYGFSDDDYILILCGRITPDKGVAQALGAFTQLAKKYLTLKIVIIGTGYITEFVNLPAPYWNRVVYTGEIDRLLVSDFYSMADIGLIPSFHEQCSFTAIEMQFHQLPLVVSDTDGLSELFTDEHDALKVSITIDENGLKKIAAQILADKIDRLLSDSTLREYLAENALAKAINIHSLSKMRQEYDMLVEELFFMDITAGS
ncbi:glycosyltransferase [Dyadobacter alkalitolerans]|uniref:glycosyltransferase n=1 Tax=Dyadobacter alkalitolerans TaxID=492736 RepID=UPI00041A719E|nr:glycosyltransferase [Dyadobacter alkalitolerans]